MLVQKIRYMWTAGISESHFKTGSSAPSSCMVFVNPVRNVPRYDLGHVYGVSYLWHRSGCDSDSSPITLKNSRKQLVVEMWSDRNDSQARKIHGIPSNNWSLSVSNSFRGDLSTKETVILSSWKHRFSNAFSSQIVRAVSLINVVGFWASVAVQESSPVNTSSPKYN